MYNRLKEIEECLAQCGVQAELRTERKDPYVNVGDVKHVVNRMQFWVPKDVNAIDMFVGKEMGKWYEHSKSSPYLATPYKYSDKENKVNFPNVDAAKGFIKEVADA